MALDRSEYIGSHDIAAIIPSKEGGFRIIEGAYLSAYEVWANKRGIGNPFKETISTRSGLALEPIILDEWWKTQKHFDRERYELVTCAYDDVREGGRQVGEGFRLGYRLEPSLANIFNGERGEPTETIGVYAFGIHLRSKSHPHCGCSPDALVYDTQEERFVAGVDAKCANNEGWKKYEVLAENGLPQNLMVQGDYMCAISGLTEWYFPVLHKGWDTITEFKSVAHADHKKLLDCAENFWRKYIDANVEPPSSGTAYKNFAPIQKRLHPERGEPKKPTQDDIDMWRRYQEAHDEESKAKARKDTLKTALSDSANGADGIEGVFSYTKSGAFKIHKED